MLSFGQAGAHGAFANVANATRSLSSQVKAGRSRQVKDIDDIDSMSSLWLFSHLEVVYGVHHQVFAEGSFTVPQSGVGGGVGWFIKVHVHVHTSSALTSHLVILDDTSRVRWWGSNVYVHGHTSSTLISHLVLLNDTSGVRWGWVGWGGVWTFMYIFVHHRLWHHI